MTAEADRRRGEPLMSSVDLRLQTSLELQATELWFKLERINRRSLGDQDCKVEEGKMGLYSSAPNPQTRTPIIRL